MTTDSLSQNRLNEIVQFLKGTLAKEEIRCLNQRAIQAKVWQNPIVSSYMADLRREEEVIRMKIMDKLSYLIYRFHEHALDATLARAGIVSDDRIHAGSSLEQTGKNEFDLFCLDAKERLYLILKEYGWMKDFFRFHPEHFYENSFQFVDRIPKKKLPITVKVVGLGIGGAMAVSGLAKSGVQTVQGFEKRCRSGPRSVTSRFQNASWRAYEIAEKLLDNEAYEKMIAYRQRINMTHDDGTEAVMTSDRVQIILGSAIDSAIKSAERYGAQLHFDCEDESYTNSAEPADIVALFSGAHTSELFPGLKEIMNIASWPELKSYCKLWLSIKMSDKTYPYTTRGGEVGAEKWHYTIESARETTEDIIRIQDNLNAQFVWKCKLIKDGKSKDDLDDVRSRYTSQHDKLDNILKSLEETKEKDNVRFDYIFTNAPDNEHNNAKRDFAAKNGSLVIDGSYQVDVKIADKSAICIQKSNEDEKKVLDNLRTKVLVTGGDACVPPNPMAAYGATLACEFADMLVQLAISHGHTNAILMGIKGKHVCDHEWAKSLQEVADLFTEYYDARGRSENYFQWIQTTICNLYSLPPF